MKSKSEIIEVKTTIKKLGIKSSNTGFTINDYQEIIVNEKIMKVPVNKIIHNNSLIAYTEYATRQYDTDLDFLINNKEITIKIEIISTILPKWFPFKSFFNSIYTNYTLIPYWKGSCYNILRTKIVYTKEQYEKGITAMKSNNIYKTYKGCDEKYPGICIASASPCTDLTTGEIKK